MITARHEELAALHALGLLEGAEKAALVAELAANPELRAWVDDLAESAATLALSVPPVEPPAGLKERILASAHSAGSGRPERSRTGATDPAPGSVMPFPLLRLVPWAAAAGFALVAAWLSFQNIGLRRDNEALRTERELAETAYKMTHNQLAERTLLAETMITDLGRRLARQEDLTRLKVTALAALLPGSKEAQAIAVWDPDQQAGLLTVEKLPAIAEMQDYQIWVVDPAYPDPVDGGVFKPGADGGAVLAFKGAKPIRTASAFAISLERKGGVPKAEGPMVLLGK